MKVRTVREPPVIKAISLVLSVIFLLAGGVKLSGAEMMMESFRGWGYSITFMYIIGILEVSAAVMLFMARLRVYGATLISILMIGAAFTHIRAGEWLLTPVPVIVLALAAAIVGAHRTTERLAERHA